MSVNYLRLIPTDPNYVPAPEQQEDARTWLKAHYPAADEIQFKTFPTVEFIDQGGNFEALFCPCCDAKLEIEGWWVAAMDQSFATGFTDLYVTMPCCGRCVSLNELRYDWPAGFARFVMDVRNPWDDRVSAAGFHELERIVASPLRRIWRHL